MRREVRGREKERKKEREREGKREREKEREKERERERTDIKDARNASEVVLNRRRVANFGADTLVRCSFDENKAAIALHTQ